MVNDVLDTCRKWILSMRYIVLSVMPKHRCIKNRTINLMGSFVRQDVIRLEIFFQNLTEMRHGNQTKTLFNK